MKTLFNYGRVHALYLKYNLHTFRDGYSSSSAILLLNKTL